MNELKEMAIFFAFC